MVSVLRRGKNEHAHIKQSNRFEDHQDRDLLGLPKIVVSEVISIVTALLPLQGTKTTTVLQTLTATTTVTQTPAQTTTAGGGGDGGGSGSGGSGSGSGGSDESSTTGGIPISTATTATPNTTIMPSTETTAIIGSQSSGGSSLIASTVGQQSVSHSGAGLIALGDGTGTQTGGIADPTGQTLSSGAAGTLTSPGSKATAGSSGSSSSSGGRGGSSDNPDGSSGGSGSGGHNSLSSGAIGTITVFSVLAILAVFLHIFRKRVIAKRSERNKRWHKKFVNEVPNSRSSSFSAGERSELDVETPSMVQVAPSAPSLVSPMTSAGEALPPIASGGMRSLNEDRPGTANSTNDLIAMLDDAETVSLKSSKAPMSVRPFSSSESFYFPKPPSGIRQQHESLNAESSHTSSSMSSDFRDNSSSGNSGTSRTTSTSIGETSSILDPFADPEVPRLPETSYGDRRKVETVSHSFWAHRSDEISVTPGDVVRVKKIFENGWAYIEKLESQMDDGTMVMDDKAMGLIPVGCFTDSDLNSGGGSVENGSSYGH